MRKPKTIEQWKVDVSNLRKTNKELQNSYDSIRLSLVDKVKELDAARKSLVEKDIEIAKLKIKANGSESRVKSLERDALFNAGASCAYQKTVERLVDNLTERK